MVQFKGRKNSLLLKSALAKYKSIPHVREDSLLSLVSLF